MERSLEHELENEMENEAELEAELENEAAHEAHELEAHESESHEHEAHELEAHEHETELESEFETELESEFEGESEFEAESEQGEQFLGSIVSGLGSLFGQGEGEFEAHEQEFEMEAEGELEMESELEQGEQFFGKIFRGIRRIARRAAPILRRVAKVAAPIVGKVVSGITPFGALAGPALNALTGALGEHELESEAHEHEQEHELGEHEISHELPEHEAMAEAMAHFAAQAEHELESEAMTGAAVTIVLSARDRRALRRLVPHLVRGAAILTRILRMRRATRPMVRVIPSIVRRTVRTLRRSAVAGRPITRRRAGAIMARQTRRVLSSPRYCTAALARSVRAARSVSRPRAVLARSALRRRRGI